MEHDPAAPDTIVDLKGLKCPLPVLRLRRRLSDVAPGTVLVVQCTDPMAAIDVPHLLRETGDGLIETIRAEGVLTFRIVRARPVETAG